MEDVATFNPEMTQMYSYIFQHHGYMVHWDGKTGKMTEIQEDEMGGQNLLCIMPYLSTSWGIDISSTNLSHRLAALNFATCPRRESVLVLAGVHPMS